ncbi:MAG TPA: heavy-metal-associated domain-containing protein [Usitatibacter sp.]|nr:heavy-metal-associated domain-containing protein [Usitatibacter sp.]
MIEMNVPDMTCNHCAATIRKAVLGIDQSAACEVDLDSKRVRVASALPPSDFVEALEEVGYSPTLVSAIG